MMQLAWIVMVVLSWTTVAHAANFALCESDGTFQQYRTSLNTPLFENGINIKDPDMSGVTGVPQRHLKCVDTDADNIHDAVAEMTQAEKDAVDAPRAVEEARFQALQDEIATNDLCTAADLDTITARIDTVADTIDWSNPNQVKTLWKRSTKKIVKCLKARLDTEP